MKSIDFFYKKFSIGLTLSTNIIDFEKFLKKYAIFIDNIYFSLPLGNKFHARTNVIKQFKNPELVNMFWELLKLIKKYDIKLELVLNNGNIKKSDVIKCKEVLKEKNIEVDYIGITNDIYEIVKSEFNDKKIVYSFKNRTNTIEDYENISNKYDYYVVGRQNIRNNNIFKYIYLNKKSKVILLLNNGCSHKCGGCTTIKNCHFSYYKERFNFNSEYLYALQSIMPHEIHQELIDLTYVSYFKINSRNSSLKELDECLNSYINCIEDEYIIKSKENFILWARLAWHTEFYNEFSLQRIRDIKRKIIENTTVQIERNYLNFNIDLRDNYILNGSNENYDIVNSEELLSKMLKSIPYKVKGCIIGVSNCRKLFREVSILKTNTFIKKMRNMFKEVNLCIPKLIKEDYEYLDIFLSNIDKEYVDSLIVNDWATARHIVSKYTFLIAIGESLTFGNINTEANDYNTENDNHFGEKLIGSGLKENIRRFGKVRFIICNMPSNGLCISKDEKEKIYVNLFQQNICLLPEKQCNNTCLIDRSNQCQYINMLKNCKIHFNNIQGSLNITEGIKKTICENRAEFIIKL